MAGKKMRGRKNNAHNLGYAKYTSENRKRKNKDRKQRKHNILIRKVVDKAKERIALLQECVEKAKTTSYVIKRIIGTPNISRLTSFLNETIFDKEWFLNRYCSKGLRKRLNGTSLVIYGERMGANLRNKEDICY